MAKLTQEYNTLAEHLFDPTKVQIVNGEVSLKSIVDPTEILFSNFDGNTLPVLPTLSKRGNKTIVFSGADNTGQVLGGILDFPNQDGSVAQYLEITDIVDDFAIRARCEMNVNTIGSDRDLMVLDSNIDNSRIRFYLNDQGFGITRIRREIRDSAGAITDNTIIGTRVFAINPNFNIAFSNDDNGDTLTWFDGVSYPTIVSPSFDFTDCNFTFGDTAEALANYDNIQLFNSNAITSAFAFPFPEPTTYSLGEHVILTTVPFLMDQIIDFSVGEDKGLSGNINSGTFLVKNVDNLYNNNANNLWEEADATLAKSNSADEIKNNVATFPLVKGVGAYVQVARVFESTDGYANIIIDSFFIEYIFEFKVSVLNTCLVYGEVTDNAGDPIVGATVDFDTKNKIVDNSIVIPKASTVTNDQGKWSLKLIETETDNTSGTFTIGHESFEDPEVFKRRIIPNFPSKKFKELLLEE